MSTLDKLLLIFTVIVLVAVSILTFGIISRIDEQTIALIAGTVVGVVVAGPAGILIGVGLTHAWRGRSGEGNSHVTLRFPGQAPYTPPVQAPYGYLPPQAQDPYAQTPRLPRRQDYIIGDTGEQTEF